MKYKTNVDIPITNKLSREAIIQFLENGRYLDVLTVFTDLDTGNVAINLKEWFTDEEAEEIVEIVNKCLQRKFGEDYSLPTKKV